MPIPDRCGVVETIVENRWEWNTTWASTPCKHGKLLRCSRCGTGTRDTLHSTTNGRGCVALLREGSKKT